MLKVFFYSLLLSFAIVSLCQAQLQYKPQPKIKLHDKHNDKGSGINTISIDKEKETRLTELGMLWGFIKYYHPAASVGIGKMDEELFHILPQVLAAKDKAQADSVMEVWVDNFGKPAPCDSCPEIKKSDSTKLMPDYGYLFSKDHFPASLISKLEYIKRNRNIGKSAYVDLAPNVGNPIFIGEQPYFNNTYPDAGLRLLALYRYWNIIQYFYPYRHLIGEDWNKTLTDFIPQFINAKDSAEYTLVCLKLICSVHDSHAIIIGGRVINELKGEYLVPASVAFVEDKLVVTAPYIDSINNISLQPGDIINKIDGEAVSELVKKYLPITPGSNYESQLIDMSGRNGFLLRRHTKDALLSIIRDDKPLDIKLALVSMRERRSKTIGNENDTNKEAYKILPGNIGYIYPGKWKEKDINKIKKALNNTKGIIIDMRCYPASYMPIVYGEWLNPKPVSFVKFTFASLQTPGMFHFSQPKANEIGTSNRNYYKGKVVILVNSSTQSAAEYAVMALATAPKATVVGSTTAGADGNVSAFILPGGIRTMISGVGIYYPNGMETQRKGVKIDKQVKPTIKGIKEGKDELLESAKKIINTP